jgi:hypothetical protein
VLKPWQFMLLTLAGWINRSQQEAIEYLRAENQVLVEQLKGKRLRLTDEQRRKLAIPGQDTGAQAVGGSGYDRDARYDSGVAPEAHRTEVDVPAKGSRATADGEGSRAIGAFDGGGEPRLGIYQLG